MCSTHSVHDPFCKLFPSPNVNRIKYITSHSIQFTNHNLVHFSRFGIFFSSQNREMMEKLEELETSHNHLLKRLDKLKNAKSTLLKEL